MRTSFAIVALALLASGCSAAHHSRPNASLATLRRLTADQTSFGVILDARTGKALTAFRVNNPIRAAVADGRGGWYIGGGFIHVNGVLRKRLAHIDQDGRLDGNWKPEANGNGVSVTSMARIGSRLYVAGDFARLDGKPRLWLGAVDAESGKLLGWQPQHGSINYPVLLARPNRLYVGGYAVRQGSGLVALRPGDGARETEWRGRVDTSNIEGGSVRILALRGRRLYFSGMFATVDGRSVPGIAAVDAETGQIDPRWRPPLRARLCSACTEVGALAVGQERVYAGLPSSVLALDPSTGAVERGWRVRLGLSTGIYGGAGATALSKLGKRLYLTGSFDTIDGKPRLSFGAVDVRTGGVVPTWTPAAGSAYGSVLAGSGSRLLLGIQLTSAVQFDVGGLEAAKQPFPRLDVLLALSGPGSVRIGLGRHCDFARWAETSHCAGRVATWLGTVDFARAGRRRYRHAIPWPTGHRYFVRFVPRARGGAPQPPYDDVFRH